MRNMNNGQIKLDNKERRVNTVIASRTIDSNFKSQAESEYEKKKSKIKKDIIDQITRVTE